MSHPQDRDGTLSSNYGNSPAHMDLPIPDSKLPRPFSHESNALLTELPGLDIPRFHAIRKAGTVHGTQIWKYGLSNPIYSNLQSFRQKWNALPTELLWLDPSTNIKVALSRNWRKPTGFWRCFILSGFLATRRCNVFLWFLGDFT